MDGGTCARALSEEGLVQIKLRWGELGIGSLGTGGLRAGDNVRLLPTMLPPTLGGRTTTRQCPRGPLFVRVPDAPSPPARHCGRFLYCSCGFEDQIQPLPCELLKSECQLFFADESFWEGFGHNNFQPRSSSDNISCRAMRNTLRNGPRRNLGTFSSRSWPTLAKTDFGQTDFDLCLCVFVGVCVCLCGVGVGFTVSVWGFQSCSVPPEPPFPWTAQNFALFFSLSRRKIRSFLPSLGVFSLNFGGVFEGWNPQMCTFVVSGCRVKPRRLRGRRGLHT